MLLKSDGTLGWINRLYGETPAIVGSISFTSDNSEVISIMASKGAGSFAVLRFNVSTG